MSSNIEGAIGTGPQSPIGAGSIAPPVASPGNGDPLNSPDMLGTPPPGPAVPIASPVEPGMSTPPANPVAAPVSPQQAPPPNLRTQLSKALGINLGHYQDDAQALRGLSGLIQQSMQWREQANQLQQIVPYWSQFQQFMQQQQAPQQQQPQNQTQQKGWWSVPEYDERWLQAVEVGEDGQPRVKAGYSPDILWKLNNYQNWQRDSLSRILRDPIGTLKEGIVDLVQPLIQQAVAGNLGSYEQRNQAHNIIQQNSHWMFESDQGGSPILNPVTGQRTLSPAGKIYTDNLKVLASQGINDPQRQHQLAFHNTVGQLTILAQQSRQQQAPQAAPQQPPQTMNSMARMATTATAATPPTTNQFGGGTSLEAMIRNAFAANGITDADFQQGF